MTSYETSSYFVWLLTDMWTRVPVSTWHKINNLSFDVALEVKDLQHNSRCDDLDVCINFSFPYKYEIVNMFTLVSVVNVTCYLVCEHMVVMGLSWLDNYSVRWAPHDVTWWSMDQKQAFLSTFFYRLDKLAKYLKMRQVLKPHHSLCNDLTSCNLRLYLT